MVVTVVSAVECHPEHQPNGNKVLEAGHLELRKSTQLRTQASPPPIFLPTSGGRLPGAAATARQAVDNRSMQAMYFSQTRQRTRVVPYAGKEGRLVTSECSVFVFLLVPSLFSLLVHVILLCVCLQIHIVLPNFIITQLKLTLGGEDKVLSDVSDESNSRERYKWNP